MKKLFFLVTFIFSLSMLCSIESTRKDELSLSMKEIDRLIKSTEYNMALDLLSKYIIENPEKFDIAQKRISKIMKIREKYNELVEQLLFVLNNDPENAVKIYELSSAIENYEKNPTDISFSFIREARNASRIAYLKAKYDEIMDTGSRQVKSGKIAEAVYTFRQGFSLFSEDMENTELYTSSMISQINGNISKIDSIIKKFSQLKVEMETAKAVYLDSLAKKDYLTCEKSLKDLNSQTKRFVAYFVELSQVGNDFTEMQDVAMENNPNFSETSYISFLEHFTLGRISDVDTGILNAVRAYYITRLEEMKSITKTIALKNFNETVEIAKADTFFYEKLNDAKTTASFCIKLNELYDETGIVYEDFTGNFIFVQNFLDLKNKAMANQRTLENNVSFEKSVFDVGSKEFGKLSKENEFFMSIKSETEKISQDKILLERKAFEEVLKSQESEVAEIRYTPGCTIDNEVIFFDEKIESLDSYCKSIENSAFEKLFENWIYISSSYAKDSNIKFKNYDEKFAEVKNLYYGIPDKENPELIKKYPSEASEKIKQIEKTIQKDLEILSTYSLTMKGVDNAIYERREFIENENNVESDIENLSKIKFALVDIKDFCSRDIQKAQMAKNEGDLRYKEAVAALKKNNFAEVRSALHRSRIKYNESLELQESEKLRNETDLLLTKLGEETTKKENEIVVKEVRVLKNNAKKAYFEGDFERADNYLTEAKTRWNVTNVDDDEEILNLQAMVTTALSMITGRDIPVTSPLYPEMSQILNKAFLQFDEGKMLISKNRKDAEKILYECRENVHQIQIVFPLNKEASLLNLKIDQLIDKENFSSMIETRILQAKANYKKAELKQSSYFDLKDLYEINPDYPGLKKLIYDVEIEIGLRQKPVDNSAKTKSTKLAQNAKSIYDGAKGNEDKLKKALSTLDEAIKLNPDNSVAQNLKDKIQTEIGGQAVLELSSADEAVFQKAIQALQKNNLLTANALVEQLLQKSKNKRSAKILDLQKKVKALL